jgi:hypothetical protein
VRSRIELHPELDGREELSEDLTRQTMYQLAHPRFDRFVAMLYGRRRKCKKMLLSDVSVHGEDDENGQVEECVARTGTKRLVWPQGAEEDEAGLLHKVTSFGLCVRLLDRLRV